MRVLFVLQYPGYLRYFDGVIAGLVSRGHSVAVAYDSPHKQSEGREALDGVPVTDVGAMPRRGSEWEPLVRGLRGTVDYARYLHPDFRESHYLRDRMRKALPMLTRAVGRLRTLSGPGTKALLACLRACERAVPPSETLRLFLKHQRPDVVVVSPLVTDQCPQVDVVKAAQSLGIPAALGVASWDHLTTKGLTRVVPDLVLVWNEHQKDEAVKYHALPGERIVVTGAQPFDRWFGRTPSRSRESFFELVGLPSDRPMVLFVGSTASISNPSAETEFVREWTRQLRQALDRQGLGVSILVRPHPYNSAHWRDADLSDIGNVAVFPRHAANPVNERDRADYFDSLFHSAAVVGINTSAMIEAAVVGRTVHTVLDPAFALTQQGTLHFRYLLPDNGGFLRVAASLEEHVRQVSATLTAPDANKPALDAFVQRFVRPYGSDSAAAPRVIAALETLGRHSPRRTMRMPVVLYPLRFTLWVVACLATGYTDPARLRRLLVRKARKSFRVKKKSRRTTQPGRNIPS